MVRKQYWWSRRRLKRTRPRTPAPKNGWLIAELAQIGEVSVRTLRYYLTQGLIRPMERRGTATRYSRRELLRLLAVLRLRVETSLKLIEIKRRLDALGDAELEAWLVSRPMSPAAAAALGIADANGQAGAVANISANSNMNASGASARLPWESGAQPSEHRAGVQTWHHIELLPGMQLMVSSNASLAVMNAARKVYDEFVRR